MSLPRAGRPKPRACRPPSDGSLPRGGIHLPAAPRPPRIWPSLLLELAVTAGALRYLHGAYRPLAVLAALCGVGVLVRAWVRGRRL